jgi:hypothetical protein
LPDVWQVVEKVITPCPADVDICRAQAKRGNLQLLWVSNLKIATVACGDLAMTIAAFFNSLSDEPVEKNSALTGSDFFSFPYSD